MKKVVNPISLEKKQDLLDKAIESIEARMSIQPSKPQHQERSAANDTAISVLKQAIERTQANIDQAKAAVFAAEQAASEARILATSLHSQEEKEARSLYLIAKASGYSKHELQSLMHEMNLDCDEDDCEACISKFRPDWRE